MSSTNDEVKLPGFGLPLDEMPPWHRHGENKRYPHAIRDDVGRVPATQREKRMIDFINQVTDKPRWTEKIKDEEIVGRWRMEACGTERQQETSPVHLSTGQFDYCMRELKDKATYLQKYGVVHVFDVNATIVKADLSDDDDLCQMLSRAVQPLEQVPEASKDWHPGADGLVLDLLHPSMFPLMYGTSRALPRGNVGLTDCSAYIGCGVQLSIPQVVQEKKSFLRSSSGMDFPFKPWGSYQWLPSEVRIRQDGSTSIDSYVNNLHPQNHPEIYSVLEKAVGRALPLWNECLSWFHERYRIRTDSYGFEYDLYKDPGIDGLDWEDERTRDDWLRDHPQERELMHPDDEDLVDFTPFEESIAKKGMQRLDLAAKFPSGLQVIFKLANVELTPEKPRYEGSNWHVEGALNEHICATALVYYDQANIEDTYLEFRQEVDSMSVTTLAPQNDPLAVEDMFGIEEEGASVQDIGKVLTRASRMVAFPNIMQHRVRPFSLADPTKPGHRKILAMFLVDPHIKILSTANVPPQRRDWWAEEVHKIMPFASLPVELFDRIIEGVEDFPIDWEEACAMREELMEERGRIRDDFEQIHVDDSFNFCEH